MAQYSYAQLKQLWIQNGGNPLVADIAAAVAMAESGGRSDAINSSNSDGSTDRGLWQINSVHGKLSTTDPIANVKAAIQISNNGKNWTPWVTFVSGAYKKFLSPTTAAGGGVPADTASSSGIPGVGGISVSGLVQSAVNQLLKMMGLGSVKDLLERTGLIILGFAIVILGIHLLASGGGGSGQAINVNVDKGESGTKTTTKIKTPVSQHRITNTSGRRAAAGTGTGEAMEAAAVA